MPDQLPTLPPLMQTTPDEIWAALDSVPQAARVWIPDSAIDSVCRAWTADAGRAGLALPVEHAALGAVLQVAVRDGRGCVVVERTLLERAARAWRPAYDALLARVHASGVPTTSR